MSFLDRISSSFKSSAMMTNLIIINVVVFLVFNLTYHLSGKTIALSEYTGAYANPKGFLIHIWGVFTYMFSHMDFGHVFYNMLMFFFMSRLFVSVIGGQRLFFVYLFGGICGALLFFLTAQVIPGSENKILIGASASVMAVAVSIGFYAPNMPISLFLFGEVKLKWVVIAAFVISSVIDISDNSGGKISHIGGALFGMLYGLQLKNRKDIGAWFIGLGKRRSKLKVVHNARASDYDYNQGKKEEQKSLDELLEKIHKSGFDSLSKSEKETLHRLSKKQ